MYPVNNYSTLNYLVITGNPFAIAADQHMTTKKLEIQMSIKNGELINESLAPPAFTRSRVQTSQNSAGTYGRKPMTSNSGAYTDSTRPGTFYQNYDRRALIAVN